MLSINVNQNVIRTNDKTERVYDGQKLAAAWQNQQNDRAPREDWDQPGHSPNLIWVFAVRKGEVDAQADLSLRWAHR